MYLRALIAAFALFVSSYASAATLESYSRLPAVDLFDISDDGTTMVYARTREGQQTVIVQRLDGQVLQMVNVGDVKLRELQWAGPDHVLITTSSTSTVQWLILEGELYQATSLNVRTGAATQLIRRVRADDSYANIIIGYPVAGTWEGQPVAYVQAIAATQGFAAGRLDVLRVGLDDGIAREHNMGSHETRRFTVLPNGAVVAQETYESETGRWRLLTRAGAAGGWRTAMEMIAPIDFPDVEAVSADGQSVVVSRFNEQTQEWDYLPVVTSTGAVGDALPAPARSVVVTDRQNSLIGYVNAGHFLRYTFNNPEHTAVWQTVTQALPNRQVRLVSFTPNFRRLIIHVQGSGYPGNYMLFDADASRLTQIGREYPDIAENEIAEVRSITYRASDGLEIQAYLTLPPGREPANLPLVVLPHGGPQQHDIAGFDWMAQSLASRGYAVLQPNFRGSSGFGRQFVEAGYGEWGRKMQTDLSDGIAHLAGRGMVDASRVCIMGASYGGYAALAGVTLQNGVYRCAVAIAPVSDVQEFLSWRVTRGGRENSSYRYWTRYLGVNEHTDPRLREISPQRAAANGDAPVLLIHGRDDTVVPYAQSTGMRNALSNAGRSVQLVDLRAEDHWLSGEATRIQTMQAAVAFIEQHNPPR